MTGSSAPDSGKDGNTATRNDDRPRNTNELARERTDLAYERSRLAMERTTMGYLRTSISLIGFGFAIPTFFQMLKEVPGLEDLSATRPRFLGLSLLTLAIVMLATAIVQQSTYLRRLSKESGTSFPFSITMLSSFVVLVIAISSTAIILFRIGPA
jgi:putative membrane protein